MAQGNLKLSKKKPARLTKRQQNPKAAAPKVYRAKKNLTEKKVQLLSKQHNGALISNTEKLIASRVGHLELVKGSRREIEKAAKEKAKAKAAEAKAKQ
ncbi:unnamed protein product [Kuraishia capsulata CBS 1993]|uniref:Uncharacterized protein n=1 Tax=Kuraishia capsulata CBS 1993 TaxID=1382522 RepID=W6MFH7_9ASCO|nr:uncharacterized protein KUCA_T00000301001 [Kuraishia capsulata CBS 1993]CDK24341.1 unnamed protein product [Kuraishia capsulata CBS 1993]